MPLYKVQYYVISTYEFRVNVGNSHMFRRYRKANPPFMTNDTSVSWAANWSGGLWLRFMPAIPLPFEGGRCQELTELCTSPQHDWWPQGGLFPNPPVSPLAKTYTGRGGLWCEMMERRIQRVDLYSKKPRHVYNNSQLWLGWNFYLSCHSLIKFHILKWLLWHCTLELKCDMKGAHFSA